MRGHSIFIGEKIVKKILAALAVGGLLLCAVPVLADDATGVDAAVAGEAVPEAAPAAAGTTTTVVTTTTTEYVEETTHYAPVRKAWRPKKVWHRPAPRQCNCTCTTTCR